MEIWEHPKPEAVKALIKSIGSYRKVAKLTGVKSHNTVAKWCNGESKIKMEYWVFLKGLVDGKKTRADSV